MSVSVHPADRGDLLRPGGGHGSGVHGDLQSAWEQRHGVHAAGSAQQGRRHQPCRGGEEMHIHPCIQREKYIQIDGESII